MKTILDRLAFSTLGTPDWDFETAVEHAKNLGFCAIEVRGLGDELHTDKLPPFLPENRAKTFELLKESGIFISDAGTSVAFHDLDNFDAALEEGKAAIDTCYALHIPAIRVFGDRIPEGMTEKETAVRVAKGIRMLCEYSAAHAEGKVQIWQEVHGEFNNIGILSEMAKNLADCPLYGFIWDIEHTFRLGEDPHLFFNTFSHLIQHTHIKDCLLNDSEPVVMLPGEGILPVADYIKILEEGGYKGLYSFEWEKRWIRDLPDPEIALPKYVEMMKKIANS